MFLPIVLVGFYVLAKFNAIKLVKVWLVVSSLYFYSYWNHKYLILITFSIIFNFFIGKALLANKKSFRKKSVLILGVTLNVGLLFYFKYMNFFVENLNSSFGFDFTNIKIILPLAISFFTFQQVAYIVDSYYARHENFDFMTYSLFVVFFPQLIAGPIVHHQEILPQFGKKETFHMNWKNVATGLYIFCIGLFKKSVIADTLAVWVNKGFFQNEGISVISSWFASLSYSFQLYFDFSGYADMAIGLGLLFNIKLPDNFNYPYMAMNIQDFWRRWHISMSKWFQQYVYIPLGGSKFGSLFTLRNLFITSFISGVWHGASWTFIVWGMAHGFALIIHRTFKQRGYSMNIYIAWCLTFLFINFTWVVFRAENFIIAGNILRAMIGYTNSTVDLKQIWNYESNFEVFKFLSVIFCMLTVVFLKEGNRILINISTRRSIFRYSFVVSVLFFTSIFVIGVRFLEPSYNPEFIYFQF
jgi:D-alanyl-lipoteichoic acid acyltransferase DltB (MBOAT superfamily)